MIVRMTPHQLGVCREYAEQSVAMTYWLYDHAVQVSVARVDVTMPAVGWRQLADAIRPVAYTMYGGRNDGASDGHRRVLRHITKALVHLEVHPAMTNLYLPGRNSELLSGWPLGIDWSPYPTPGAHRVLAPEMVQVNGMGVTRWVPRAWEVGDPWVLSEMAALAFTPLGTHAVPRAV